MNQPLHLSLTAALLLPLSFAATSICPPGKTGRVPTAGCAGYADCVNGALSAQYPCTAGTLYDAKSGICNWPANVVCDAEGEEDEEVYDDDDDYTDDRETVDGDELIAKFCPAGFTGKAPTTDCLGYVLCTNGSEGLSAKCPTDSFFNSMTLRCEYGFKDCQLLVTQQQTTAQLSQYAKFCPEAYTGKAPTEGCGGYVKCSAGSVTEVFSCPQGTKFDIMKLSCTYADVDCDANKEVEEEEELEEEDDKPVDHSKYCPDDYTGRAPTKNCAGYIDCRKGKVKLVKDCPAGTKFDVMILACTFSEVQCEANVQATYHPTPSPFDGKRDKDDRPERIIADEECPAGFTGNKAINGCKGYIYCAAGTQLGKFACSSGTMFDAATGYCNWSANVNTDVPDCQTSSPSYTPTMSPMNPTASPSYTPTILDMEGEIFYPDYKNGICKNDDKYPPSLSSIYLRASAHGCCTSFFNSAYERCMQAFESESPSMAPSGERSWYPDYDFNLCRSDLNYSPYEANFFASYERCCKFDFLDEAECLMKKPSAMGLIYYPHYPSGTCKNDGRQPLDEVWLYTSKKDCCKNDQVQPYKSCMEGDGAGDMVQNSAGISTSTTTTTTPEVKSWYPD
ncbi:hypothetical protein ACHAWO_008980 [Cyclotella atomus]|uniref:Chitin-binding type-2 domain-containing protein n=1 Tax=Cyclotella atomus TaxID=382360 RepID=A0ABD3Q9P2_9STRA